MSRAAVPRYVGQDFHAAAPGHRFNLYFEIWNDHWAMVNNGKAQAIGRTLPMGSAAGLLKNLRDRQECLAQSLPETARVILPAKSTSPFATGLGLEHPVENGFAFLSPYGLPYLAGSGVKGVLRRAAEELVFVEGENSLTPTPLPEGEGLTLLDIWWLVGFEGAAGAFWPLSRKEERELSDAQKEMRAVWRNTYLAQLDTLAKRSDLPEFIGRVLDKREAAKYRDDPRTFLDALDTLREGIHLRGALSFWDVFPRCEKMAVEIMTPHYGDYYQGKSTPHDAGQPNPIPFLAVPAGSEFTFIATCEPAFLPENLKENWKPLLETIFEHAFDWLGFGAKTAVGYGAMAIDEKTVQEQRERETALRIEKHRTAMSPESWAVEEFRAYYLEQKDKGRYQPGSSFDEKRRAIATAAVRWQDTEARKGLAALLRQTVKEWTDWPNKKERKAELRGWLEQLETCHD